MLDRMKDSNDRFLKSFRFQAYINRTRKLAHSPPLNGSAADWPILLRNLENVSVLFRAVPKERKQFMFRVASEHLRLSRLARDLRGRAYVEYFTQTNLRLQIDEDIPQAIERNPLGRATTEDVADPVGLALTISDLLDAYKRQLSYMAGLVSLLRGEDPSTRGLVMKATHVLERMLLAHGRGPWPGIVLGDEYSHVHRGLASHSSLHSPDENTLHLRHGHLSSKHRWAGEYTSAELTSMMLHIASWECGWILGRMMETAELGAFVEEI